MFTRVAERTYLCARTLYPFLKKYRSPRMEVAASNTSERLHCSFRGLDRSGLGSSVGSSGSGSGGGLGFGAVVGACVRLPESDNQSEKE